MILPVLSPADQVVAKLLLRESTELPKYPSRAERAEFGARWRPWLQEEAPGPVEVGFGQAA